MNLTFTILIREITFVGLANSRRKRTIFKISFTNLAQRTVRKMTITITPAVFESAATFSVWLSFWILSWRKRHSQKSPWTVIWCRIGGLIRHFYICTKHTRISARGPTISLAVRVFSFEGMAVVRRTDVGNCITIRGLRARLRDFFSRIKVWSGIARTWIHVFIYLGHIFRRLTTCDSIVAATFRLMNVNACFIRILTFSVNNWR